MEKKYRLAKGFPLGIIKTKQKWVEEHMNAYGFDHNQKFNTKEGLRLCRKNVNWMIINKWLIEEQINDFKLVENKEKKE